MTTHTSGNFCGRGPQTSTNAALASAGELALTDLTWLFGDWSPCGRFCSQLNCPWSLLVLPSPPCNMCREWRRGAWRTSIRAAQRSRPVAPRRLRWPRCCDQALEGCNGCPSCFDGPMILLKWSCCAGWCTAMLWTRFHRFRAMAMSI